MSDTNTTADIRATADATGNHGGESSVAAAHPAAVKGGATLSVTVLLLALLVGSVAVFLMSSSPQHQHHAGKLIGHEDGLGQEQEGRARGAPVEHAVGMDAGVVVPPPGFNSRVDAFRTWARLAWMKLLRRPGSSEDGEPWQAGEQQQPAGSSVAGAAKKSFQAGKETVEQAAAAAGKATRETVGAAKDKAKRAAVAADDGEDEEL